MSTVLWVGRFDGVELEHDPDGGNLFASGYEEALIRLTEHTVDCVVLDYHLEEEPTGATANRTGLDVLETIRDRRPDLPIVLCTDEADGEIAAAATRLGVAEYVPRSSHDDLPTEDLTTYLHERAEKLSGNIRERTIESFVEATGELLEAQTMTQVTDVTTRIATDVLGFEDAVVHLVEDGELVPVSCATVRGDAPLDLEAVAIDGTTIGTAFREGTSILREDVPETSDEGDDRRWTLGHYSLGSHGVLSLAVPEPREFDPFDRRLATRLTTTVTAALDRTSRRDELRRYESVFDVVRDMVFVLDEEGEIVMVTDPLLEWGGYDRSQIVGRSAGDFVAAEYRDATSDLFEALASSDEPKTETYQLEIRAVNGATRPVEIEAATMPNDSGFAGLVGVVRDISTLVKTQAELDQERHRFASLFEHLPDPINEVTFEDGEPVIRAVNPAFETVFGYEASEIVGECSNDILPPPNDREHKRARTLDKLARDRGVVSAEVRRQTASGLRHFLFRGVVHDDGDPQRAFGIYTDITDQHLRERRLQVLQRVLRHNLRNDLSIVRGYADLARQEIEPALEDVPGIDEAVDHIDLIESSAESLTDLSRKVRQMERVFERNSLPTDEIDLGAIVESTTQRFATMNGIEIETAVVTDGSVVGDDRLEIALENLVENAIEHGSNRYHPWESDDGTVEQIDPKVRVVLEPCGDHPEGWVALRVIDDGPGIPPQEREVVAGDLDITQLSHGSGLGLWVVAWVVRSLGGELSFADREPRGSEVTIRLRRGTAETQVES